QVTVVDPLLIDAYMPEDLYINEQQIYVFNQLDWIKNIHQEVPVISNNQAMSLGTSYYHIDTYEEIDMDVHGSLYKNEDSNYVMMVSITKPYSFHTGDNLNIPIDYVFIEYTPYFEMTFSSCKFYLSFDDETEYLQNWYGYQGNAYIQLPTNTYSQYFKYPKLVYTMYFEFEKDPTIETDYFEFNMTVIESITNNNRMMLGFNQFVGEQYTLFKATAYSVAYEEER
ncbi:MAG: hypothetical protein AB7U79_08380, partial [Candidatus Izemoplasmatales bacterium]